MYKQLLSKRVVSTVELTVTIVVDICIGDDGHSVTTKRMSVHRFDRYRHRGEFKDFEIYYHSNGTVVKQATHSFGDFGSKNNWVIDRKVL